MTASLFPSAVALPDLSTPCAWAGIGSRETPADVLALMTRIARRLAELGHTLRSGAAPGADTAFEAGHREACGAERLEVYLPWAAFEREERTRRGWLKGVALQRATMPAMDIASIHHPNWLRLSNGERMLHGRNSHQVLGHSLDIPARFAILWTPDGATLAKETNRGTGGTGQAIRVSDMVAGIPVYNLQRDDHRRAWERWLDAA